jgi:hypothetical protein
MEIISSWYCDVGLALDLGLDQYEELMLDF